LALAPLLGSCATPPREAYKLYPGVARPASEVARIEYGAACVLVVDGLRARSRDWNGVVVLPGEHRVRWSLEIADDAALEPSDAPSVALEAGHVYCVRRELAGEVVVRGYTWLADVADERVVCGERPALRH
jgi:hypothetical protein